MAVFQDQLSMADVSAEYAAFVEKFKPKKTTDDCYTPENIYEAVADWACKEYRIDRGRLVRPFWPGGDYERFDYPDGCVVLDNPPFSIIKQICDFYNANGVSFFLFAPSLTVPLRDFRNCAIVADACITYENGAEVNTAFITNLEKKYILRTSPELHDRIEAENKKNLVKVKKQMPKYSYPDHVVTAALAQRYANHGVEFLVRKDEAAYVNALDAQRAAGKKVFGGGLLLSERAASERAAARRAAAERAAAERAAVERWELSARELEIVAQLSEEA